MSLFIQKNLIRWILQPLAGVSNRIPQKLRSFLFVLCGTLIMSMNVLNNSAAVSLRYLYIFVFDCLMVGIMLLCTLPKEILPIKFDKKLLIPLAGFTLFMLIAGVTKSIDYLADAVLFLVMFPVIFIVWNNIAFSRIVNLLACTARMVAIIFFFVSVVYFPITGSKYASCFANVNEFAIFLSCLFAFLLIGFINGKKASVFRWVDLLLLGIAWALTYYSNSRTGQLACLMAAACTLLLLLIQEKRRLKCLLWDVLPVVLVLVICTQAVVPAFVGINTAIDRCRNAIVAFFDRGDPVPTTPGSLPTTPGTEPTTPGTEPTKPSISAEDIWKDIENIQSIKTDTEGKTLNQLSTSRIEIWKSVLDHVTFWGHAVNETFTFPYKGKIAEFSTSHMTILDFAYDYGFLAGVCYLLLNLLAGVKSIGFALRDPRERWMLAPFAITITYGCISLLASTAAVYSYMIAFSYYLVQAPLMASRRKP